jgi:hypothetical protein
MDLLPTICLVTIASVALVFAGVLATRMLAYIGRPQLDDTGGFSAERYQPMMRLLSEEDFRF